MIARPTGNRTGQAANVPTDCIRSGPHIMIVGSPSLAEGHDARAAQGSKAPFVVSAGTPYAHLIVPVG